MLETSSLTLYDRATLSASFYYYWDDRLNCERALSQLSTRTVGVDHAEKAIRARFGCHTVADKPKVIINRIGYHSCLCKFLHPLFFAYLDLLNRLDAGVLPDRGAYLDQPAHTVEALQLLSQLRSEASATEAQQNGRQ